MHDQTFYASAHRRVPTGMWPAPTAPPSKEAGPWQCPLVSVKGGCVSSCVGALLFTAHASNGNEAKLVNSI